MRNILVRDNNTFITFNIFAVCCLTLFHFMHSSCHIWEGLQPSYVTLEIDPDCALWEESPIPYLLVVQKKKKEKKETILFL